MTRERLKPAPLTTRPSVTVVVPCYNYGRFLPQAVGSALSQEGVDVDVIVVDDCSTDGSVAVADRLVNGDARVRLLHHESNQGHIRTYNDGLAEATGDFVVLLSADDVLASNALARACALFEARPDVGLVYGYAADFSDCPPTPRTSPTSWTVWSGATWLRRICARGTNIIVNPEAMLRGPLMKELGGYDPRHPHAADMELWMRAASRANVARLNGVDQAFYRVHGQNMHTTSFSGLLTDITERRRVFDALLGSATPAVPNAGPLLIRARESLAAEALRHACLAVDDGGTLGGATAQDFAAFAAETDPNIVGTRRWNAYDSRVRGGAGPARRLGARLANSLAWKYRWRRWRRFGT